jgi:NADH-quinone oxidoreductase subunit L
MHVLAGELDIFKMGGLRKKMPWTFATVLVGVLAISGVPLLSGFFSKDEILSAAFAEGNPWLWLVGIVTAGMTAFYAFRLLFVTFFGKTRLPKKAAAQVHESPPVMVVPLVILAALAVVGGYIGLPKVLGLGNAIDDFLHPVFAHTHHVEPTVSAGAEWGLIGASVLAAALGILLAYWLYIRRWGTAERWSQSAKWLYDLVYNKYYIDEAYTEAIVKPLKALGGFLAESVEVQGIDGAVNGLARVVGLAGEGLRRLQTGLVRNYALALLGGVVALIAYFLLRGL